MDTDRFVEFLSTVVIVGMIAVLALPRFGVSGVTDVLLASAAVAVAVGGPFAAFLVYVLDLESSHVGPWGPEDVVFIAVIGPSAFGVLWGAEQLGLDGAMYGVVVAVGLFASILFAAVVRDATVGEWPPGSGARDRTGGGPPGGR